MEKFNIGIIGIGDISDVYIKNLQKYKDEVTVLGCASRGIEKAKAKAEMFGIPRYYASGDELIEDPDIDIVLNLTIPEVHYDYNKKALEGGKHVYSEKPLASTFEQGKELLKIAERKGFCIGCAPDTFMGGRLQTYKKLIDNGTLGKVFGATVTSVSHGGEWFHPNPAFFYQPGAGPLYDIGPYYMTALLSILGPVKRIQAMCTTAEQERVIESGPRKGERIKVSPEVSTHVVANLEFKEGTVATVIMSFEVWDSELPRMEIYGTKGTLTMQEPDPCDGPNLFGGDVLLRTRDNYRWKELPRNPEDLQKPWTKVPVTHDHNSVSHAENSRGIGLIDMVQAINEKREARASGAMALHLLEVMEGIIRSARERHEVKTTTDFSVPGLLPEKF
jgi:predicted dehydrogenase